jgi:hypothetical protein
MPRAYPGANRTPPGTNIHVVWTDKPGFTRTFTDRTAAERYAAKQRKYSGMVQFKSHPNLNKASNWIAVQNQQLLVIKNQIHHISASTIDVSDQMKSPLELLLQEQDNWHPPLLRTCIFFVDGSKKPNRNATIGLLSKQLGIAETITLSEEYNHQSAELSGLSFALEAFYIELEGNKDIGVAFNRVVCVSDSDYSIKIMKKWVHDWIAKFGEDGEWQTTRKEPVKFTHIIKRILGLERSITNAGVKVEYLWVPRKDNAEADILSNGKKLPLSAYTETPKNCTQEEWDKLCKPSPEQQ